MDEAKYHFGNEDKSRLNNMYLIWCPHPLNIKEGNQTVFIIRKSNAKNY